MTTTTSKHAGIESTIKLLQAELPDLEARQHTLEKDLAAVTGRLGVVRTALGSLEALASGSVPSQGAAAKAPAEPEPAVEQPQSAAAEQHDGAAAPSVPAPRRVRDSATGRRGAGSKAKAKTTAGRKKAAGAAKTKRPAVRVGRKSSSAPKAAQKSASKRTEGLTDGVVACLAKAKNPMRAGEVNDALGRENTKGSVNSVRTALERLAAASRVERVGRGLYKASVH